MVSHGTHEPMFWSHILAAIWSMNRMIMRRFFGGWAVCPFTVLHNRAHCLVCRLTQYQEIMHAPMDVVWNIVRTWVARIVCLGLNVHACAVQLVCHSGSLLLSWSECLGGVKGGRARGALWLPTHGNPPWLCCSNLPYDHSACLPFFHDCSICPFVGFSILTC